MYNIYMKQLTINYKNNDLNIKLDDDMYDKVVKYKWSVISTKRDGVSNLYFRARVNGKYVYMHRYICNVDNFMLVDHIDRDNLNNQRLNLRAVTKQQNSMNKRMSVTRSLKWRGYSKSGDKYTAQINDGPVRWVSYGFITEEEAAKAYDRMAKLLYGEYANLNFPE